jgi:curved DNA-binding protein CbpA
MDIQSCLQVLELPSGASPEQIRRAYKDLAAVWHPDRFAGNPRLRRRAEAKLKEINRAYEALEALASPGKGPGAPSVADHPPQHTDDGAGNAEAYAELGTRLFLVFCSRIYSRCRDWITAESAEAGVPQWQEDKAHGDRKPSDHRKV